MLSFDPAALEPQRVYQLLVDSVLPRPIGWISSIGADGSVNLAPFSFFNLVSSNPPVLFFSVSTPRGSSAKDTLRNIREVPEFVANVVTEDLAEAMNATAAPLPYSASEFDHAGLAAAPSEAVRPPRVAASPVQLECTVIDVRSFGDNPGSGNMVLGRIVRIHVDETVMGADGRVDPVKLRAIGRLGRDDYTRTVPPFTIRRPG